MSQPDRSFTEPHVSPDELRAALAPRRSRPSPVAAAAGRRVERDPAPAWEWSTELSDGDQAELAELRSTVAAQRERIDALEQALSGARTNARESREALSELAAAGRFRRRALRRELAGRGLL
jgi:Spy/CpxP family protein refolding chaperone